MGMGKTTGRFEVEDFTIHVHVLLESAKLSQRVVRGLPALKLFVHAIGNMLEVREINIVETQASREFPNSFNRV